MSRHEKELLRRFKPEQQAGPDNPLPGQIFDPKTEEFLGYEPKSVGFPVTGGATDATVAASALPPPVRDWRNERPNSLGGRIWQDMGETITDIKEEPKEVPFRIRERVKEYFRNPLARPK